jgi:hypothetical protein
MAFPFPDKRENRQSPPRYLVKPGSNVKTLSSGPNAQKVYRPLGRSHALKKGLTNLISFPLLNRILMLIIRVIARLTDAELWCPTAFTKSIE